MVIVSNIELDEILVDYQSNNDNSTNNTGNHEDNSDRSLGIEDVKLEILMKRSCFRHYLCNCGV